MAVEVTQMMVGVLRESYSQHNRDLSGFVSLQRAGNYIQGSGNSMLAAWKPS